LWFDGLIEQVRAAGMALFELRGLGVWWASLDATSGAREAVWIGATWVLGIVTLAWLLEGFAVRLLAKPRRLVQAYAARRLGTHLLQRLPYTLAHAALYLLPLTAFLVITGITSNALLTGTRTFFVVLAITNAYAGVRIALAFTQGLFAPKNSRLRLCMINDEQANQAYDGARMIFIITAIGVGLGECLEQFGASEHLRLLTLKLASLIVHIMLIVFILRMRQPVAQIVRGPPSVGTTHSSWQAVRAFAANIWAPLAVVGIAALWLVWALGMANGFERVLHFIAVTAVVLLGARVVAVVAYGVLDAGFTRLDRFLVDKRAVSGRRYRALVRGALTSVLMLATMVMLLLVWGAPVTSWFAPDTFGRRIASACWTIAMALLLAVFVWELAGYAIERRIEAWIATGDTLRVARLRTLLPILRTALLTLIGLVVLFTVLSELGVNTAPLLASAGILSAAIAFGSQNLVKDFVTGVFLLMENTMQVGDTVTVAGVTGVVEHLSVRTVRLRASDGSLHTVPFSSVTTVNNTNRGLGNATVRITVTPDTDIAQVYETVCAISAEMRADSAFSDLILADIEVWGVDHIDGAAITIAGQIKTVDRGRWGVQREFNRRVLERFRQQDIRLANPRESTMVAASGPTQDSGRA
jgi:small-conductance mechanosensitive channel